MKTQKKNMERKPEWLRSMFAQQRTAIAIENAREVRHLMNNLSLNTVCKEANCPNMGECYAKRTATFMIMGSQCTRNCRFCNVVHGLPEPLDRNEPENVALAVRNLNLKHVVITSVTRDDLPHGGAEHFAEVTRTVREMNPQVTIELLIPDLLGREESLDVVLESRPDILNHNMETVRSLYDTVRPQARYERSLHVLKYCKDSGGGILTKTGMMVGLGEKEEEVFQLMDDVLETGCDILTIGQYLRPSREHLPVVEYVRPEQFEKYRKIGLEKGFSFVASAPLVRSSYQAESAFGACREKEHSR
ncbi:MAG: lipoyl synthase [Peptostreptococcaceae bacterium]|nr:lipoyl synthase [Peptostreptococcaceae bacterium]